MIKGRTLKEFFKQQFGFPTRNLRSTDAIEAVRKAQQDLDAAEQWLLEARSVAVQLNVAENLLCEVEITNV